MATDHRKAAEERIQDLIALLTSTPQADALRPLVDECQFLARAIAAFHMEGIRFRMFNVDRLLTRGSFPLPCTAADVFADVRRELEAAGFHTRSH